MAYRVEFDPAASRDLKKLDRAVQQRLVGFLKTRVALLIDPFGNTMGLNQAKR